MEQSYLARAAGYVTEQRKRQNWQRIVSGLCAVVVFCTVYVLILPAITLTAPLSCGLEEHQHDESCYTMSGSVQLLRQQVCSEESIYADVKEEERYAPFVLHVHDELCYQDGALTCTLPEVPPHIHDEECWIDVLDDLICGLEETPEGEIPVGHTHTSDCYVEVLACGREEGASIEGHTHDESCYTTETVPGALICGNPEEDHQHDESCYSEDTETSYLTCGQEESAFIEGHTHTPNCYEMQLVCGQEESEAAPAHVHTEACYASKERVELCFDPKIAHEHIPLRYNEYGEAINADVACYDAYGVLTCTKWVTREHVHTEACFQEVEDPSVEPTETLTCEVAEHIHDESCYTLEDAEEPEQPEQPEQDDPWDAIFWSDVVTESSDVVLDAWTSGSWIDTAAMDPERLEQMRAAGESDLTRALESASIQVGYQAYDSTLHGPMDSGRDFSIMLTWSLNSNSFTGMTYTYQLPWQISVENVEKRVLNDANGSPALTYSVWNNALIVTYYAPAESVTTRFSLRAFWSEEMGADTLIQWSRSDSTYVVFAEPELTVEKTMGEDGLRVAEDGTVWADYTVTVTNSGMVAAGDITLTDVLEAERFHFAQGAYESGADYIVTVDGRESYETFPDYGGGDTITFPAFDLAVGESRVFQYMAVMSAEDRELVDAAVKASADPTQTGETVRNTATAVCHAFSGDLEFTSMSRATYGGPESKHVENFTQTYGAGSFNVSFTVNGDAQLPLGMTMEKLERTTGEGLQLTVETLDETMEEYQAFTEDVEEDSELLDLQVLRIGLNYNGVELDLTDCDIEAVVIPGEALINYQPPHVVNYGLTEEEKEAAEDEKPLGDEGYGIVLEAFALSEETETDAASEFVEAGSVYLDKGDDSELNAVETEVEPIKFAVNQRMLAVNARTQPYPEYMVEFWANLERIERTTNGTGTNKLEIVDTSAESGGKLPTNTSINKRYLTLLTEDDPSTPENEAGAIKTVSKCIQLFVPKSLVFNPKRVLTLDMFNVLDQFDEKDQNYVVAEAYIVPKNGPERKIADKNGNTDLTKVNLSEVTLEGLQADDTVKFVFNTEQGSHTNAAVFYDYDITDGKMYTSRSGSVSKDSNGKVLTDSVTLGGEVTRTNANTQYEWEAEHQDDPYLFADTRQKGINSLGEGVSGASGYFAFGNANTGTGLEKVTWNGYTLNKYNNSTGFRGCTFGLANSTLVNGMFAFANGVYGPNLFNQPGAAVEGKTTYADEYSLEFKRVGDTYTLRTVNGTNNNFSQNLDRLHAFNLSEGLYSNEFWPMDNTKSHGTEGHDFKFGSLARYRYRVRWDDNDYRTDAEHSRLSGINNDDDFPPSDFPTGKVTTFDPERDHNAYFGMQFSVEFSIPKGYIGPLDYCFFGDDDLWLYLTDLSTGTSQLVCDIGGVHLTAGEYVDLQDYLKDGTQEVGGKTYTKLKEGKYRLDLYYLERGASGSTCWMQYTLPGIQSVPVDVPPDPDRGNLKIEKKVEGIVDKETLFRFQLDMAANYDCLYLDGEGFQLSAEEIEARNLPATTSSSTIFTLKANESVTVRNIDVGTRYTIKEIEEPDDANSYETSITVSQGNTVSTTEAKSVSGSIEKDTTIHVTYTNTFYFALPETGGAGTSGTVWYTMGALPVMTAAILVYKKKSRRKGGTEF